MNTGESLPCCRFCSLCRLSMGVEERNTPGKLCKTCTSPKVMRIAIMVLLTPVILILAAAICWQLIPLFFNFGTTVIWYLTMSVFVILAVPCSIALAYWLVVDVPLMTFHSFSSANLRFLTNWH